MGGCCSTDPLAYKTKYKEKDIGIIKHHQHMLVYSNFYWREYRDEGFKCAACETLIGNNGCFHCRACNYSICPKCFDELKGKLINKYQVNQKGRFNRHQHILEYKDIISRNIPIIARPNYICKICQGNFLMEYVNAWNCPRCGYDFCEKCFYENGGKVI